MYRDAVSGKAFLCLGYHFQTAFLWRTSEHASGFFQLSEQELDLTECKDRFRTCSLTEVLKPAEEEGSPWRGIPTKVCFSSKGYTQDLDASTSDF